LSRVGRIVAIVTLALAGASADRAFALPAPEELVPNTVARVSHVPKRWGTITKREFRHQLVLAAAAQGLRHPPEPGGRRYEQLARGALQSLLEGIWIRGLAGELNIAVSHDEVRRRLAVLKEQAFRSGAEYRRFLRESRLTRRDVHERIEIEMLGKRLERRIQKRIEREARNGYEERKAWREFVAEFNEQWRERTICAPAYVTERCSNGPPLE
jgi:hypothetical protein